MGTKQADLAGPGISTYEEVAKILPKNYDSILTPKETMRALFGVKNYIEEGLSRELNLMMVQVPLIVDRDSGFNDMLETIEKAGVSKDDEPWSAARRRVRGDAGSGASTAPQDSLWPVMSPLRATRRPAPR